MPNFREEEILKFFKVLDGLLEKNESLFLIGGAAVVVGYHSNRMTKDVDAWMKVSPGIQDKWDEAVKKTGLTLSLEVAGIAEAAYSMEERVDVKLKLKKLTVLTPSALDLIIMKIPRFSDNDKKDIYLLIKEMTADKLLVAFKDEFLPYCIGNKRMVALNYLEMIETAYGQDVADTHAIAIGFDNL